MSKLEKNHIEINGNNENSQTGIRCCDNSPAFTITYDVAGVLVVYSVCKPCSKLNCFSQFIAEKVPVKNKNEKIKNNSENTEQNEVIEGIIENTGEHNERHTVNPEHTERHTSTTLVSDGGEN